MSMYFQSSVCKSLFLRLERSNWKHNMIFLANVHEFGSTHISRWLCQINPVQNIVRMMGWFFLFMTLQKVQMLCYYECRGWLLFHPEAAEIHFRGPCRCSRWLLWPLCCRLLAPLKSSNQQRHPEAVFEICVATCISDVVFITGSSLPTPSITTC